MVDKDLKAAKTYRDPVWLKKCERLRLAERMWEAGLWGTCPKAIEYVVPFAVVKRYDEAGNRSLRPVWDLRRGNQRWLLTEALDSRLVSL